MLIRGYERMEREERGRGAVEGRGWNYIRSRVEGRHAHELSWAGKTQGTGHCLQHEFLRPAFLLFSRLLVGWLLSAPAWTKQRMPAAPHSAIRGSFACSSLLLLPDSDRN